MKTVCWIAGLAGLGLGYYLGFMSGAFMRMEPMVTVATARSEFRPGSYIKEPQSLFEMKSCHRDAVPANALGELESLRGRMLSRSLGAGEVCTWQHLAEPDFIPDGMRAFDLRVSSDDNADALPPGTRVDVIAIIADAPIKQEAFSRIVLQNLEVLPIGQRVNAALPRPTGVVTLAVTPEEAEMLANISRSCLPRLARRKAGDTKIVKTPGFGWPPDR